MNQQYAPENSGKVKIYIMPLKCEMQASYCNYIHTFELRNFQIVMSKPLLQILHAIAWP